MKLAGAVDKRVEHERYECSIDPYPVVDGRVWKVYLLELFADLDLVQDRTSRVIGGDAELGGKEEFDASCFCGFGEGDLGEDG